jgi:uncharacterized protein YggE
MGYRLLTHPLAEPLVRVHRHSGSERQPNGTQLGERSMQGNRIVIPTVLALVALALAAISLAAPALAGNTKQEGGNVIQAAPTDTTRTINVGGTGRVTVTPDMATVIIGVVERADSAKVAQEQAAKKMAAVVDSIKKNGVADKDIQTINVSLNPVYDYSDNTQKLIAYEANQSVQIKVRKLADTGAIIDEAVQAGAANVSSIMLSLADTTGPVAEARKLAVTDAKAKADQLASAAGVRIVSVMTITENSAPGPVPVVYPEAGGAMAADKAITPIEAGSQEITVDVSIVYEID